MRIYYNKSYRKVFCLKISFSTLTFSLKGDILWLLLGTFKLPASLLLRVLEPLLSKIMLSKH